MSLDDTTHCNVETTRVARPSNATATWSGWEPAQSVKIEGSKATITTANPSATVHGVRYAFGDIPSNDSSVAVLNGQFLYDGEELPMGVFIAECDDQSQCQMLPGGQVNPSSRAVTQKTDDGDSAVELAPVLPPGPPATCQGNPKPPGAGCGPPFSPGWGFTKKGGFPPTPWRHNHASQTEGLFGAYFVGNASGMDSPAELAKEVKLGYVGIGWQLNNIPSHYSHLEKFEIIEAQRLKKLRPGVKVGVLRNTEVVTVFWDSANKVMHDPSTQDYWTQCGGRPCVGSWGSPAGSTAKYWMVSQRSC
jgi:hypothetical protein